MTENEFLKLKDKDVVRLKKSSAKQFKGRYNEINKYFVLCSRLGKTIRDEAGANRNFSDIFEHFYLV